VETQFYRDADNDLAIFDILIQETLGQGLAFGEIFIARENGVVDNSVQEKVDIDKFAQEGLNFKIDAAVADVVEVPFKIMG
jgi:hypothetical protein